MNRIKINQNKFRYFLLFILLVSPWFNANYFDNVTAVELGTEDTSFYEINPCKVSLAEYINADFQSTYKKHYFFRYNNYSSISCFGKVSGIALQNDIFNISIGTNSFINIILQSIFWIILFSFIKKDENVKFVPKYKLISTLLTTFLLIYSVFSQKRFYESQFYVFDFEKLSSYFFLFILFFVIVKIFLDVITPRMGSMINYTPFLFLFIGVLSGFNLTLFTIPFLFLGFSSILSFENKKLNLIYLLFLAFWINNANSAFSFNTDKLRGFTSSSFDLNAVIYWSLFFILLVNGLLTFFRQHHVYFNFYKFKKYYSISAIYIFLLGLLVSNLPIFNFLTYYFFGQQKYGVKNSNPFLVDIFNNNEKIPWRGFYPSAESLGEFYGLLICFIVYSFIKSNKISKLDFISLMLSGMGLFFANNKTVTILVLFIVLILLITEFQISRSIRFFLFSSFLLIFVFIVGFSNLTYPYEFSSATLYDQALKYKDPSVTSSSLDLFINVYEKETILFHVFSFFGYISYLLNRSELWGLFIARYSPNTNEFLFGSSPLNLSQHYSEIRINEPGSLLLPHSSILSMFVYFGILGLLLGLLLYIMKAYKWRENINIFGLLLLFYILINLLKSDSINYFSSFILYSQLYYLVTNIKNKDIFK
ncbi:MAG: hypothetical protein CL470_08920 [Acidimicrobiaceae bacterium]|nr:hypothetical protein [Acidimicrobiaceae bacterium]